MSSSSSAAGVICQSAGRILQPLEWAMLAGACPKTRLHPHFLWAHG